MRILYSRRPVTFLLVALFVLGVALACNLPLLQGSGKYLTQDEALQLVLDEVVNPISWVEIR